MTIDTNWEFKATHWEAQAKRLIAQNELLKSDLLLSESKARDLVQALQDLANVSVGDDLLGYVRDVARAALKQAEA